MRLTTILHGGRELLENPLPGSLHVAFLPLRQRWVSLRFARIFVRGEAFSLCDRLYAEDWFAISLANPTLDATTQILSARLPIPC